MAEVKEVKKQTKAPEKDVFVIRTTYYNGERLPAGSIIKDFDRKQKAYGVVVPLSEQGKYRKEVFNCEIKYVLKENVK